MKKKWKLLLLCAVIGCSILIPQGIAYAQDFAGNEDYYLNFCSVPRPTQEESNLCKEFREYYKNKSDDLQNQVSDLNSKINQIKGDMDLLTQTINEYETKIAELDEMIAANDAAIAKIQEGINELSDQITKTQNDIDARDRIIRDRMLSEQPSVGTNIYMDFIMGATDLMDLIRVMEGIERITENDQEQIKALEADRQKLEVQKGEKVRMQDDEKQKKEANEATKAANEEAKNSKQQLLDEYQRQEADLTEKMRSAQVNIAEIQNNIINIIVDASAVGGNAYWSIPVPSGTRSAGTWYYSGGGVHLGMDLAAPVGTPIVAPANSVVLYANNPAPTNGGYLGNWVGYPAGGGNTVLLAMEVNGITYVVSFAHMAQENFFARPGMTLTRGQQFGAVGHSGNSTGPHCHIEVINLGTIGLAEAQRQFQGHRDFSYGTGWGSSALNRICSATGGATPCRERPEEIF